MDRRLVELAQRGDLDAFDALVRITGDRCLGIAYRILRDVDLAEDAVQTAYVSAWRDLRSLRDPDRFEAWLHRTLARACYEEARQTRRFAANVRAMEAYALPIYRAGHVPVVGEWFALPLVALAGSRQVGDEAFNEIFHPIAERLLERCDAVLRVGGASQGADLMVRVAEARGLHVYRRLSDVPGCESLPEPGR